MHHVYQLLFILDNPLKLNIKTLKQAITDFTYSYLARGLFRIPNPGAAGSIPAGGTNKKKKITVNTTRDFFLFMNCCLHCFRARSRPR
ncbi:hypothetical protein D3OALGB2SA_3441 [Olavius algarvensis associated proteobacterium Delta 3]|nr:hypothetical protein D3OALGB2SA_3441 [Olavius algarvensis associated proteobacterium Delta 3]